MLKISTLRLKRGLQNCMVRSENYAQINFIRKDIDTAYLIIYQLTKGKDIKLVGLTQDFFGWK